MDAFPHESDEHLELYALGRLSDSEVIRTEEHLLACDLCRDRLDVTANVAFAIREELKSNPVLPHVGSAGWLGWLKVGWLKPGWRPQFAFAGGLAMALLALLAVGLVWNGNSRLAPVASLQLTAMRGADVQTVQAARELDITFGDGASAQNIEIVDSEGKAIWRGTPEIAAGSVRAKVMKALSPGEYFARVYDSPGHMLHEYSFRVKK